MVNSRYDNRGNIASDVIEGGTYRQLYWLFLKIWIKKSEIFGDFIFGLVEATRSISLICVFKTFLLPVSNFVNGILQIWLFTILRRILVFQIPYRMWESDELMRVCTNYDKRKLCNISVISRCKTIDKVLPLSKNGLRKRSKRREWLSLLNLLKSIFVKFCTPDCRGAGLY